MQLLALMTLTGSVAVMGRSYAEPNTAAHKAASGTIDRVGGHPNFSGVWSVMNSANWNIEPHLASAGLEMRPGPVVPVPAKAIVALGAVGSVPAGMGVVEGGTIPYKPDALAKRQDNQKHYLQRDPEIKCDLPGVPRANYQPFPFQIVQSPQTILMAYEFASASRVVRMNTKEEAPTDSWMGWSRGRWEGESLIIDVNGFNDQTWLSRAGDFHTDEMKVTERYTLADADHINYEATIDDPKTFTRPWKIAFPLYRHTEKNAQLLEFKCVEFVEELMYGHLRKRTN